MKFEETLVSSHVAEWAQYYVDYSTLKLMVREAYGQLVMQNVIRTEHDKLVSKDLAGFATSSPKAMAGLSAGEAKKRGKTGLGEEGKGRATPGGKVSPFDSDGDPLDGDDPLGDGVRLIPIDPANDNGSGNDGDGDSNGNSNSNSSALRGSPRLDGGDDNDDVHKRRKHGSNTGGGHRDDGEKGGRGQHHRPRRIPSLIPRDSDPSPLPAVSDQSSESDDMYEDSAQAAAARNRANSNTIIEGDYGTSSTSSTSSGSDRGGKVGIVDGDTVAAAGEGGKSGKLNSKKKKNRAATSSKRISKRVKSAGNGDGSGDVVDGGKGAANASSPQWAVTISTVPGRDHNSATAPGKNGSKKSQSLGGGGGGGGGLTSPATTSRRGSHASQGSHVGIRDRLGESFVERCREEWDRADTFLRDESERVRARLVDVVASLAAMALETKRNPKIAEVMEEAVRDLHSHATKLVRFAELNREAVRKATKKFDKRTGSSVTPVVLADIKARRALDSKLPEALEERARQLFASYFTSHNIAVATNNLRMRAEDSPHWRVFTLVGASISLACLLVYEVAANRGRVTSSDGSLVLTTMRITIAVNVLLLFFAGVLAIARRYRINHRLVMRLERLSMLGWAGFLEIASSLALVHLVLITVYVRTLISENRGGDNLPPWPAYTYILAIPVLMLLGSALPLRVWHHRTRFYFWRILSRIVSAPFSHVGFTEVFMADQLTSVTGFLVHAQFAVCLASAQDDGQDVSMSSSSSSISSSISSTSVDSAASSVSSCSLTKSPAIFVLSMLPSWFRMMQCLRVFYDKGGVHPNLTNALKYMSNIVTVCFALAHSVAAGGSGWSAYRYLWLLSGIASSTYKFWWDVRMDWKLTWSLADPTGGSRYRSLPRLSYTAAVLLDFLLRNIWLLSLASVLQGDEWWLTATTYFEIARRSMWNVFRIERDHYLNCMAGRAVNELPLPYGDARNSALERVSGSDRARGAIRGRDRDVRPVGRLENGFRKPHAT